MNGIEYAIDGEPCSRDEFHIRQSAAQVLCGNTFHHIATWPNGRMVISACSPDRVTIHDDGTYEVARVDQ